MLIKLKKSYFNLDICNEYYEGYHDPSYRWNGWAVPCFTKEIAEKIIQNIFTDDCECSKVTYDKGKNEYVAIIDGEEEIYEMNTINTDEGINQVYFIGAGYWRWEDFSLKEIEQNPDAIIIKSHNENDKEIPISMDY